MKTNNMKIQLKKLASAIKFSHLAYAGIVAGQVVAPGAYATPGDYTFDQEKGTIEFEGKTINVTQIEDFFSIDWESFDLDADEIINFLHETEGNTSFAVLNRITGNSVSEIHGQINSDGHVILINPRGILFSDTARVDVGAITASGLDIDPGQIGEDFSFGNELTLSAIEEAGTGYVINRGVINASSGSAALIGRQVVNAGTAQLTAAKLVSLTAADEAILTFDTDGLIGVSIQKEVMENVLGEDSALLNDGSLIGAQVLMQADVSGNLFTHAVNNRGMVDASGIDTSDGSIRLTGSGGSIANSGVDAEMTASGALAVDTEQSFVNTGSISADTAEITVGTAGEGSENALGDFSVTQSATVTGHVDEGESEITDSFSLASGETVKVTGEKAFDLGGKISFSAIDTVDVGTSTLDATSIEAGVKLTGTDKTLETAGMLFSSVDTAKATKVSSDTSRTDYVISGANALTAGGIGFSDLTSLDGAAGSVQLDALVVDSDIALDSDENGNLSGYTVNGISVTGIDTLNVNSNKVESAKLLGRNGSEDTFKVVKDDEGVIGVSSGALLFNNVTDVDGNSATNSLEAIADIQLIGNTAMNEADSSDIRFSNISSASGGDLKVSNNGDTFQVTGENTVKANGIEFEDIAEITLGTTTEDSAGENSVIGAENVDWYLIGSENDSAKNNEITFHNVKSITANDAGLHGDANVEETFVLNTAGNVEVNGIEFSELLWVDGYGGQGHQDTLKSSGYPGSLWLEYGSERVLRTQEEGGIVFNNIWKAEAPRLVGTAGDDDFVLSEVEVSEGENVTYLTSAGIQFSGLEEVDAAGGDSIEAIGTVTLTGEAKAAKISEITFSNIDAISATSLAGSDKVDTFTLYMEENGWGNDTGETKLKANEIDFGEFRGTVDGGDGEDWIVDERSHGNWDAVTNGLKLQKNDSGVYVFQVHEGADPVEGLEFTGITDVQTRTLYADQEVYTFDVFGDHKTKMGIGIEFIGLTDVYAKDGSTLTASYSEAEATGQTIGGIQFHGNNLIVDIGVVRFESDWIGVLYFPGDAEAEGEGFYLELYQDGQLVDTRNYSNVKSVDVADAEINVHGLGGKDWNILDVDNETIAQSDGTQFFNVRYLTANDAMAMIGNGANGFLSMDADGVLHLIVSGIQITGMNGIDGGSGTNNLLNAAGLGAELVLKMDGPEALYSLDTLTVEGLSIENFADVAAGSLTTYLSEPPSYEPEIDEEGNPLPPEPGIPSPLVYTINGENSLRVGGVGIGFQGLTEFTSDNPYGADVSLAYSNTVNTDLAADITLSGAGGDVSGFLANGIDIKGVTTVDTSGVTSATLHGYGENNVFTARRDSGTTRITADGFEFSDISALDAAKGRLNVSYTKDSGASERYTLDENGVLTVSSLGLSASDLGYLYAGATENTISVQGTAGILAANKISTGVGDFSFTAENIHNVNGTGILTGRTSADKFTVASAGEVSSSGILFSDVTEVNARGEGNSLTGSMGTGESWELLGGAGELGYGGISFYDLASTTSGNGTLTGSGAGDVFSVTADNKLTANQIAFGNITKVSAGSGEDSVSAASGTEWVLGADINTATAAKIAFTGIDRVKGDNVVLDAASNKVKDDFVLSAGGSQLGVRGITFESVSQVSATAGTESSLTSGAAQWALDATTGTLSVNNVSFTGVEKAISTSNASLTTITSGGETFELDDNNAFTVAGMGFSGIDAVAAGGANNRLLGYSDSANTYNLTADGDISTAAMLFSGIGEVSSGTGADTVSADGASWTSAVDGGALREGVAEATVNGITLVFHDLTQVNGAGTYSGQNLDSDYHLSGPDTLSIGGISYSGLTELVAGSGVDTLHGANIDSQWTLSGNRNTLVASGAQLDFSGFEAIVAGKGADQFTLSGGSLDSIDTGDGNNSVRLAGTALSRLTLGNGNNQVRVDADMDQKLSIAGGTGDNRLLFNLAGKTWNVTGEEGSATIGNFAISGFNYLDNAAGDLQLNTDQNFDFVSANEDGAQFADSGLFLAYNGDNNVTVTSSGTGTIGGRLRAARADLIVSGDVDLETQVDALSVFTTGADIDVAILADDDLKIGQIDAGRGDIRLISAGFGSLTAENYGDTHLHGNNIQVGNEQLQWNTIGDIVLPLRVDSSGAVEFVSFSYFEPEFAGSLPNFTATGDRLQSIASAQASQGLKSASQNGLEDQAQLDEGIFTEVTPYSTGVNTLSAPELSLIGGELVPVEEEDEEEERQEEPVEM